MLGDLHTDKNYVYSLIQVLSDWGQICKRVDALKISISSRQLDLSSVLRFDVSK